MSPDALTADTIAAYRRDGVAALRQVIARSGSTSSARWTGHDATFVRRPGFMSPPPPERDGPREGAMLDSPAFPVVWRAGAGRVYETAP